MVIHAANIATNIYLVAPGVTYISLLLPVVALAGTWFRSLFHIVPRLYALAQKRHSLTGVRIAPSAALGGMRARIYKPFTTCCTWLVTHNAALIVYRQRRSCDWHTKT